VLPICCLADQKKTKTTLFSELGLIILIIKKNNDSKTRAVACSKRTENEKRNNIKKI
jgi:hypothetical protein